MIIAIIFFKIIQKYLTLAFRYSFLDINNLKYTFIPVITLILYLVVIFVTSLSYYGKQVNIN